VKLTDKIKDLLLNYLIKDVTRLEVIGPAGRELTHWGKPGEGYTASLQDEDRTLKIFEDIKYD